MSSPPLTARPQRARRDQDAQVEISSSTSYSSPAAQSSSAEEGGPTRISSASQKRSCHGCRQRKARCSREATGCTKCRARNEPCVYSDAVVAAPPVENLGLEEQVARMGADLASLRAEVAQLRQAQTRMMARPDPTTATIVPPLPLAPGVAPPSLANRLPIPSMPIGANHFRQAPVTPTRPRLNPEAMDPYPTPVSVSRNSRTAAALLRGSEPTSTTGGGVPLAVPVAVPPSTYQAQPSYYFPPRGVDLSSSYAVQPMPAVPAGYAMPPWSNSPGTSLHCPPQVVVPPSSWYAPPTRPSLTYPISHERPTASAMSPPPANSSTSSLPFNPSFPAGAAPAAPAPSYAGPMTITPAASSATRPSATLPWLPAHESGLYEQQRLPTPSAPRYRVLTGGRSPSAPSPPVATVDGAALRPTATSAPGVLWSVPRVSGRVQSSDTHGLGNGLQHQQQQQQQHHAVEDFSRDASANGFGLLSGGGSSRRPSLQQSVMDWQALIDDSAPTQQPSRAEEQERALRARWPA